MLTNNFPWTINSNGSMKELYFDISESIKEGIYFPTELKISVGLKDLICGCLKMEEDKRFDWVTIASHPVFK